MQAAPKEFLRNDNTSCYLERGVSVNSAGSRAEDIKKPDQHLSWSGLKMVPMLLLIKQFQIRNAIAIDFRNRLRPTQLYHRVFL